MTSQLPIPETPYPNWASFLMALCRHGRENLNKDYALTCQRAAYEQMGVNELARDPRPIGPSSHTDCAMKPYLVHKGYEADPIDVTVKETFDIGHWLHGRYYAFALSALPSGFSIEIEKEVALGDIDWWPDDEFHRQTGAIDLLLHAEPDVFGVWLTKGAADCIVDFKSQSDYSHKMHKNQPPENKPDAFGYLSQLAIYRRAQFNDDADVVIGGIPRNRPDFPMWARMISADFLDEEIERVRDRLTDPQPYPEALEVWGKEASFKCKACHFRGPCSEFWNV